VVSIFNQFKISYLIASICRNLQFFIFIFYFLYSCIWVLYVCLFVFFFFAKDWNCNECVGIGV
jgi:hypothetical protein